MLLPFRWLLYGTATTPTDEERPQVGGKLRKLPRRVTRWSEYLGTPPAPPVELVLDRGFRLEPRLGLGALSFSPSYAPVAIINARSGEGRINVNLGIAAPISGAQLGRGTVTYAVNLTDDEIAALLEIL